MLVDRLWPRGLSKAEAGADVWLKNSAPSTALRQWFAHDPGKWDEFVRRYAAELDANLGGVATLLEAARRGRVTLLYAARDTDCNQAVAFRAWLLERAGENRSAASNGTRHRSAGRAS